VLDKVPHALIPVNPLGLTITYLREDQAFTDEAAAAPPPPASPQFGSVNPRTIPPELHQ